jgi:hypothetical protein
MTRERHGVVVSEALGLAETHRKATPMRVLKTFGQIADQIAPVFLLLATAFVGGAMALAGA